MQRRWNGPIMRRYESAGESRLNASVNNLHRVESREKTVFCGLKFTRAENKRKRLYRRNHIERTAAYSAAYKYEKKAVTYDDLDGVFSRVLHCLDSFDISVRDYLGCVHTSRPFENRKLDRTFRPVGTKRVAIRNRQVYRNVKLCPAYLRNSKPRDERLGMFAMRVVAQSMGAMLSAITPLSRRRRLSR